MMYKEVIPSLELRLTKGKVIKLGHQFNCKVLKNGDLQINNYLTNGFS